MHIRHGATNSPEWISWRSMRKRCLDPNNDAYHNYGGRGITICAAWESFEAFLADMGPRPISPEGTAKRPYLTVERMDTNGNYQPGNCKWATYSEQASNTRSSHMLTINGDTMSMPQWVKVARSAGVHKMSLGILKQRISHGWDPEMAVFSPKVEAGSARRKEIAVEAMQSVDPDRRKEMSAHANACKSAKRLVVVASAMELQL